MSYTKTTWNDLTGPAIDATNLNKIEQGIYDNSIDITSINTLIGSSGTATTTQTDFMQGQLTQKLGLKYIKMKGQTSQASDPTPTNPVDVNNVTGSNVIKIGNKNLFSSKMEIGGINNTTGNNNSETNCIRTADFIEVLPSTEYTLQNDKNYNLLIYEYDSSKTFIQYTGNYTSPKTWTTQANTKYIRVRTATAGVQTDLTAKYQLEVGSSATTYIAHKEEDYEINLGSINLIDISNTTKYPSDTTNGVTVTNNGDGSLTLDGTATAKVNYFITSNPKTYFESEFGAYTYKCFGLPATCNSNISYGGQPTGENIQTYNINTAGRNYSIRIEIPSGVTVTNVRIKPMLVKGTYTATTYPNYEANVYNIELCKIGNYQDYIYKNNGKWYKHCEVGKKILNGTETWNSMGWTDRYAYRVAITDMKQTTANSDSCSAISNYYKAFSQNDLFNASNTYGIANRTNTNELILRNDDCTTGTALTTALSTNNVTIYYQKATPTEEEITYEPLLRQLDKLDKIGLYDISNISQDNSDMKMLLDFTICNDNYNGLREFIRA